MSTLFESSKSIKVMSQGHPEKQQPYMQRKQTLVLWFMTGMRLKQRLCWSPVDRIGWHSGCLRISKDTYFYPICKSLCPLLSPSSFAAVPHLGFWNKDISNQNNYSTVPNSSRSTIYLGQIADHCSISKNL